MDAIADVAVPLGEDHPEIREGVRRICADFPGAYWKELDEREAYPAEWVKAMSGAGFLAALIPEEYGGAGLPLRASPFRRCASASCPGEWERRTCRARWASGAPRN